VVPRAGVSFWALLSLRHSGHSMSHSRLEQVRSRRAIYSRKLYQSELAGCFMHLTAGPRDISALFPVKYIRFDYGVK